MAESITEWEFTADIAIREIVDSEPRWQEKVFEALVSRVLRGT